MFELERLTSYDDDSLIKELQRVASLIPDGQLSTSAFDELGKVHSRTLFARFGSWKAALSAAGLADRFDDSTESYSREDVICALKDLSVKLQRNSITKRELYEHIGISDKPLRRLFGSYRAALEAAGLEQNPAGVRYTDDDCFENLLIVWTHYERQPTISQMKEPPSRVGPKAYISRWGSWRAALAAFVERVSNDHDPVEAATVESMTVRKASVQQTIKHKTSRNIPIGLRWKVFKRDNFKCVSCGRHPASDPTVILHVDHKKPWSCGGETVLENLQTLCSKCNLGKGDDVEEL